MRTFLRKEPNLPSTSNIETPIKSEETKNNSKISLRFSKARFTQRFINLSPLLLERYLTSDPTLDESYKHKGHKKRRTMEAEETLQRRMKNRTKFILISFNLFRIIRLHHHQQMFFIFFASGIFSFVSLFLVSFPFSRSLFSISIRLGQVEWEKNYYIFIKFLT